jgi:hypothetical protein
MSFIQTHKFHRERYNYPKPPPDKPKVIPKRYKYVKPLTIKPTSLSEKGINMETTFCQTNKFIRERYKYVKPLSDQHKS